jgi:hypothetical protein
MLPKQQQAAAPQQHPVAQHLQQVTPLLTLLY